MRRIHVPEQGAPSLEDQLRAALYGASMYYATTRITHQHQVAYIVSTFTLEGWANDLEAKLGAGDPVVKYLRDMLADE